MWNDASGDFEQGLESLWEEKWGGVKSGGRGGGRRRDACEGERTAECLVSALYASWDI